MNKSSHTRIRPARTIILGFLALLSAGVFLSACGGDSGAEGSPAPDYEKALAGSPAPLAAVHKQGNELLDGGKDAFEARISELRGFPAVVNIWASWCGPCRAEFPHFQQSSASLGKKVAFLGVDSQDDADAAATFLRDNPLSYPSYSDPDEEIALSLGATHGLPATAFFNAQGEQTYIKHGPYPTQEELDADIRTYAIDGGEG